ncbi:MAG: IPTL-CTERM sorting domain-containing protein [Acidobacteriota bacterium]|nr:IPTL-CTERM sorting domain-containing protein [Acidobacteriota bacterium]
MFNKTNRLMGAIGLTLVLVLPGSAQNVELTVGDITLSPSLFDSGTAIVQVPIYMEDKVAATRANNGVRSIAYTIEVSGDTNIIEGGSAANMLVANAYIGTAATGNEQGIRDPGVDLSNVTPSSPGPSPTQGAGEIIYNPATEGGATADFPLGDLFLGGTWTVNNAFALGVKRGNISSANVIGTTTEGLILIGVMEFRVKTGLDGMAAAQLIFAARNDLQPNSNIIEFDDPMAGTILFNFDFPKADVDRGVPNFLGKVDFVDPPTCTGASIADNNGTASGSSISIQYNDITAGGDGGNVTITPSGTAEQYEITDGTNTWTVLDGDSLTINTAQPEGSPIAAQDTTTYTITPQTEFPPSSGDFSNGPTCAVSATWAPVTCTVDFTSTPMLNGSTDVTVIVENGRFNGTDYGDLDIDVVGGMSSVTLDTPVQSGNELTFTLDIADLDTITNDDVGDYTASVEGAGVSNTNSCTASLALEPPVNQTNCATAGTATIGGDLTVTLAGNSGAIDFRVGYDGNTDSGNPPGPFTWPGVIVGDALSFTVQARGFDEGSEVFVPEPAQTCPLTFVDAGCGTPGQDLATPGNPVDFGTVVTLTLETTGAIDAQVNGVSGTFNVDPFTNNNVTWTWTYTAVADEAVSATLTNPNGMETICVDAWEIDINCIPGEFESEAAIGDDSLVILGTEGCVYTVRVTNDLPAKAVTLLTVPAIGPDGSAELDVDEILPDTLYEVGFLVGDDFIPSDATGLTAFATVPTLGEWGMIAFVTLLMAAGVFYMRRKRLA